jgi:hypothetical protein|tara:strand:- start:2111 stop:2299 length:189 start_codon:yes stop_codon:yes gene_type:complete
MAKRLTAIDVAREASSKLQTHEAVCAERWKETITRIKRLEHIMIGAAGTIIILLTTMLWRQV